MRATILFLFAIFLCNCTHKKTPHYGWEPLGKGLNNLPSTLAIYKDELYVCGDFDSAGDVKTDLIARWNGQRWASLGNGVKPINDEDAEISIIAMQVFDGKLWVSGTFDSIGNVPARYVAQWDGASWDTLGGGLNSLINVFTIYKGNLIAAGYFYKGYGKSMNFIVQWNNNNKRWEPLGEGVSDYIYALCVYQGRLYVGGQFKNAGGIAVHNIASWDGSTWHEVGGGVDRPIENMWIFNNRLYVSGDFSRAGNLSVNSLASWDGRNWADATELKDIYEMTSDNPIRFALKYIVEDNLKSHDSILEYNGKVCYRILPSGNIGNLAYYKGYLYGIGLFDSIGCVKARNIVRCKVDSLH
jgi:hypothetical protein